jgi:osmotically-inducible protein OsmY
MTDPRRKSMTVRKSALAAALAAVLLAACAGTPNRESTGEAIDDSVITTKVKTALIADKRVSGMDVSVETFKGRVLLSGYVNNPDERRTAERIARNVAGVKDVNNKIAVRTD